MADIPTVDWTKVEASMSWQQGEHVTIIGPTGQGKTTLALALLPYRDWKIIIATKPRDKVLDTYCKNGWTKMKDWPPHSMTRNIVFWPKIRDGETKEQKEAISKVLRSSYNQGGWCIYIDELRHVTDFLGQKQLIELLWQQGRSLGVSLVTCAQRPSHVPLLAYDQATHLFLFGDKDESNIRRMGGLGWFERKTIMEGVGTLKKHEILYINTRDGEMFRSIVPKEKVI